jgi:hypothetical protein
MNEKRRTAPYSKFSVAGARTSVSARCAPIREQPSSGPPTTPAGTCPEGASDMSRGSSEANTPGTPPPRTPSPRTGCQNACLASTRAAESDRTFTHRTSSRAGARVHHSPRPPAAWENGGNTVLQVVRRSRLQANGPASAGWWKRPSVATAPRPNHLLSTFSLLLSRPPAARQLAGGSARASLDCPCATRPHPPRGGW